jgi:DNA-binding NarL/FixJ family response regulator
VAVVISEPLVADALVRVLQEIPSTSSKRYAVPDELPELIASNADVVICNPSLDGVFRLDLLVLTRRALPAAHLMVITQHNSPDVIGACIEHGAQSLMLASEPIPTVRSAIELVCRGGIALSLPVAALLLNSATNAKTDTSLPVPFGRGLSAREGEIILLIARGYKDTEIAASLGIATRTVHQHVSNALNKLGCHTRSEAVARVIAMAQARDDARTPARQG